MICMLYNQKVTTKQKLLAVILNNKKYVSDSDFEQKNKKNNKQWIESQDKRYRQGFEP